MAVALEVAGFTPRSPNADEPEFDIGWMVGDVVWVGEVKSLTAANEERQLRAALSQLLRYRQALSALGYEIRTVVVAEHEPVDPTWAELLSEQNIQLVWPDQFSSFLAGLRLS
jgi:hypothetical protein